MAVPYLACMTLMASLYHLPPGVLPAIRTVEGGQLGLAHPNANGTEDLGLMQVNTICIAPLARYTGLAAPAVRARLLNEPCFNIAAAGAIMATYLAEERGDLLRAVGDYHSHTPGLNEEYRILVVMAARGLPARRGPPGRTGLHHYRRPSSSTSAAASAGARTLASLSKKTNTSRPVALRDDRPATRSASAGSDPSAQAATRFAHAASAGGS